MSGLRPQGVAKSICLQLLHPGYAADEADSDVTTKASQRGELKRVGNVYSYGYGSMEYWYLRGNGIIISEHLVTTFCFVCFSTMDFVVDRDLCGCLFGLHNLHCFLDCIG
jgi:hypothetical protein